MSNRNYELDIKKFFFLIKRIQKLNESQKDNLTNFFIRKENQNIFWGGGGWGNITTEQKNQ